MKLKDLSIIFSAGVLAILFVVVNMFSYLFIEKGLLLITAGVGFIAYILKLLIGVLF